MLFNFRLIDSWLNYSAVEWQCQQSVSQISLTLHTNMFIVQQLHPPHVISMGQQQSFKTQLCGKWVRFVCTLPAAASPVIWLSSHCQAATVPCLLSCYPPFPIHPLSLHCSQCCQDIVLTNSAVTVFNLVFTLHTFYDYCNASRSGFVYRGH